ncbi:DUF6798 domain-containing protein [Leifsonia sp. AG29]|uniref:DUF6798 domain-containing protein n=1 Tax=Leifsonia sp. AG29 TaxID=2598860 RepID=UPI00131B5579|nr:DUF6798 domain-containing protein [Leifsonia sp. AG29]
MKAAPWMTTTVRYIRGPLGLAISMAVLLGTLEVWGNQAAGYIAGWGDHFVLSPEGLSWAIPGAFANDWFMESSPQPHWFFDIVTYLGQLSGHLSTAYALFWAVGLLAFGGATALMAMLVARRAAWPVAIGFTFLISQTPWEIGGTGSLVIAQALPAVTSASLVYLAVAALLTDRRWLAGVVSVLVAIVHVQEGAVIAIILGAFTVLDVVRTRRIDWRLVGAIAVTTAFVIFGLLFRPVASNLHDFVEICDTVIPYHCAAHLWSAPELMSTVGLIVLAALSVFLLPRRLRLAWLVTVGLAIAGYGLGFAADALSVPVLGPLAQGVNVYRLGVVLLPFAIWGALLPLLKPELTRWSIVRLILWALALAGFLTSPFRYVMGVTSPLFLAVIAIIAASAILGVRYRRRVSRPFIMGLSAFLLGLLFVFTAAGSGAITIKRPDFRFISNQALIQWGDQVRAAVPAGKVIVSSPRNEWTKLVTQRAVVVDCKDVPYGGKPWREWKKRIGDLGGLSQCVAPGPLLYNTLSASRLISIADEYHSDFITVDPTLTETADAMKAKGWHLLVQPVGTAGVFVFGRSS